MLAATILHSLSAVCVLLIVIGFGVFLARKGWFDAPSHRGIVSKLVNAALPCCLCYSVISKFSHGELYNLLKFAGLPFLTVGLNFLISVLFIKLGWVRPHMKGTFIAAFTGATVLFVGVPLVPDMYIPFAAVAIGAGAPPLMVAVCFAIFSNFMWGITEYAGGPGPIYFGQGFFERPRFYKINFILVTVSVLIVFTIGMLWWKLIGLY